MASGLIIIPNYMPALDTNARPIPGALLWFYLNGTTTPQAVYSDIDLSVPLTNPVPSDSSGVFPPIYADNDVVYTVAVTTALGAPITSYDNVVSSVSLSSIITTINTKISKTSIPSANDYVAPADAGDIAKAINRAFAAGVTTLRLESGTYSWATAIIMPAGSALTGSPQGAGGAVAVQCAANIDMITAGGNGVSVTGINFSHYADGQVFNSGTYTNCYFAFNSIGATSTTSTKNLVTIAGAYGNVLYNNILNNRTLSRSIAVDCISTPLFNIETTVEGNVIGGTGKGGWTGSSTLIKRPEGIRWINNRFFTTNINLEIEMVLLCFVTGNTFDQSDAYSVIFNPKETSPNGAGQISGLIFTGNWVSTPNQQTTGLGVWMNTAGGGTISDVKICQNIFEFCGVGVSWNNGDLITICDNSFLACAYGVSTLGAKHMIIDSNQFSSVSQNLILQDGASGGLHTIDNNNFDPAGSITYTPTTAANFVFGYNNTGKNLATNVATAVSGASPATASFIAVPHGLIGAPSKTKVIVNALVETGAYTQIISNVAAIDATNVTVQIWYAAAVTPGTIRANVTCSI